MAIIVMMVLAKMIRMEMAVLVILVAVVIMMSVTGEIETGRPGEWR